MTERTMDDPKTEQPPTGEPSGLQLRGDPGGPEQEPEAGAPVPRQLGAGRYVLAGFFATGMAVAYVVSKLVGAVWNRLADTIWITRHVPVLARIAEDERPTYTMLFGAAVGLWLTVWTYRREDARTWTNEVAAELAKVTWPSKKEVTNSTIVVIVTSAFATVFLALLDRFWSFVTNLVYGS